MAETAHGTRPETLYCASCKRRTKHTRVRQPITSENNPDGGMFLTDKCTECGSDGIPVRSSEVLN